MAEVEEVEVAEVEEEWEEVEEEWEEVEEEWGEEEEVVEDGGAGEDVGGEEVMVVIIIGPITLMTGHICITTIAGPLGITQMPDIQKTVLKSVMPDMMVVLTEMEK